jgi:hypothetical protein
MTAAVTMAVAAVAVAMTMVAALTLRGGCGSRCVGEAESSKGGTVLHLQALGSGGGHGLVKEPMEEGAGLGEGGNHCRCHGFDSRGCGHSSPLLTSSSPTTTTMTTTITTAMMTRMRSQGVRRKDEQMGFQGG